MLNILYTEMIKLKRSKILLLIIITALFPCLVVLAVSYVKNLYPLASWNEVFFGIGEYLNLIAPGMIGLLTGLVFSKEYSDYTINIMLTYPISELKFLLGKYIVMILITFTTYLLSFIFKLWFGLLLTNVQIPNHILELDIKISLVMVLINVALIPLAMSVCLIGKTDITPSIYSAGVLVLMVCSQTVYIPWLIPLGVAERMGYSSGGANFNIGGNTCIALIILMITFIVSSSFNILYFKRDEKY